MEGEYFVVHRQILHSYNACFYPSSNDVADSQVPASFSKLFQTIHDWGIVTTPQVNMNGISLRWPRGKLLGGCMFHLATVLTLHELTSFLRFLYQRYDVQPLTCIHCSVSDLLIVHIIARPLIMTSGLNFRKGKRVPNNGHMIAFASTETSLGFAIVHAHWNMFQII